MSGLHNRFEGTVVHARPRRSNPSGNVRISETVSIGVGDAIAVVVARTALGSLPLVVRLEGGDARPGPQLPRRSKHPTIPTPAARVATNPERRAAKPAAPRRAKERKDTLRPEAERR